MGVRKRILCLCAGALLAASSSMGTDLSEVPCEPFPSLEMKMAGVVYEAVTKEKRFEITWSSDRPDRLGAIDDDGWRTVEYFFQETDLDSLSGAYVNSWVAFQAASWRPSHSRCISLSKESTARLSREAERGGAWNTTDMAGRRTRA